jgi:hypothetical protein
MIVLVFYDCLQETGELKKAEIYCLTVVEDRSPKSRCDQDHAASETCREESFLAPSDTSYGLLEFSSYMLASSTYKDNSHTGLKPTKTHYNLILL